MGGAGCRGRWRQAEGSPSSNPAHDPCHSRSQNSAAKHLEHPQVCARFRLLGLCWLEREVGRSPTSFPELLTPGADASSWARLREVDHRSDVSALFFDDAVPVG